jgi:hypothetical protein
VVVPPSAFYEHLAGVMALPPAERHPQLLRLHDQALRPYHLLLQTLTEAQAAQPPPASSDQRTIAQIVGHIAAWDRFAVLAAGDILAGLPHPRMITDLSGYRETDGTYPVFNTIDDFNAYQARKYQTWAWEALRHFADDVAATLYNLFAQPQLLSASRLEGTAPFRKRLHNGTVVENITMGWNLWLTMIEHLAVEHAPLFEHYREAR